MNTQKLLVGALVVLGLALVGNSFRAINVNVQTPEPPFTAGAVPSLDGVDTPFVSIAGLKSYYFNVPFTATSSVVCSIKNPYLSTSTVRMFNVRTTSSLAGAAANIFSVSTTTIVDANNRGYGSSTPALVLDHSVAGGGVQDSMVWLPMSIASTSQNRSGLLSAVSYVTGESYIKISPSDFITVRIATATPSTFTSYAQGTCSGIIQAL